MKKHYLWHLISVTELKLKLEGEMKVTGVYLTHLIQFVEIRKASDYNFYGSRRK